MIDNTVKGHVYMTKKGKKVEATGQVEIKGDTHYIECETVDNPIEKAMYLKSELRPSFVKRFRTPLAEQLSVINRQ